MTDVTDQGQRDAAMAELEKLNPSSSRPRADGPATTRSSTAATASSLRLTDAKRIDLAQSAVSQSLEVVRRRIDEIGTREASIQRQGSDRILVQVPASGTGEHQAPARQDDRAAHFHMVDLDNSVADALQGKVPAGSMLLDRPKASAGPSHYLVKRQIDVSGESLVDAQPSFQQNEPVVSFRFDNAGARKFGKVTQDNVGKPFAIVLDDKVISAPRIREPILGGLGVISGSFTVQSANEPSVLLRAGALPAPLKVVEERTVGAEPKPRIDLIRGGTIACPSRACSPSSSCCSTTMAWAHRRPGAAREPGPDPRHHDPARGDAHAARHRRPRAHHRSGGRSCNVLIYERIREEMRSRAHPALGDQHRLRRGPAHHRRCQSHPPDRGAGAVPVRYRTGQGLRRHPGARRDHHHVHGDLFQPVHGRDLVRSHPSRRPAA
ncbi:MAG: hypothetical protein U1E17_14630 [Geminicoccaceae bacterium]